MNARIWITFAFLASLMWVAPAMAQRGQKLKVGDPAPGLSISEWVKGDETAIKGGTTYIVEFWATWCPPCRKSIPHLTELKSQYTDEELRIIGVTTEEPDVVKGFVKKQGRRMGYTVVIDKKSATDRAWMRLQARTVFQPHSSSAPKARCNTSAVLFPTSSTPPLRWSCRVGTTRS